mgnify:CR=1 FL=1
MSRSLINGILMKKEKIKISDKDLLTSCLPFERPILELEKTIMEMKARSESGIDLSGEIKSAESPCPTSKNIIFKTFEGSLNSLDFEDGLTAK